MSTRKSHKLLKNMNITFYKSDQKWYHNDNSNSLTLISMKIWLWDMQDAAKAVNKGDLDILKFIFTKGIAN